MYVGNSWEVAKKDGYLTKEGGKYVILSFYHVSFSHLSLVYFVDFSIAPFTFLGLSSFFID